MTRPPSLRLLSVTLLWLLSMVTASGQLTTLERDRLLREIESASGSMDPSRFPAFDLAKQNVIERVEKLESFLNRATDASNRDAWLRYFNLEPLVESIQSEASPAELLSEATAVRDRMIGTTPGLEMKAVQELRHAVNDLMDALVFRNPEQSIPKLQEQLDSLGELVRRAGESPSPDEFNAISARVSLLEASGQAENLVRAFREVFGRPNVGISIGASLVQQAIGRPVQRERPVRDCILGTRLVGDATLRGDVTASLLPSRGSAHLQLTFIGNMTSDNTGYNGPVRLKTVGNGDVTVTRSMQVDAMGITFGPTLTEATLQTRVVCIDHPLGLVRAIARKQAAKKKPLADRIALDKLRVQVGSQFASETSEVSPATPSQLLDRAEPMLQRLSLTRPTQYWSSTKDAISIDSVFRSPEQLAAPNSRPDIASPYAVAVQIHESAIENAFSVMLADRTLNERRLNEILEKVGDIKSANDENESEPPFEIRFSRSRPVIFESRDGLLRLGLRGTRFVQGDRVVNNAMEITAVYKPHTTEDAMVVLQRDGDVDVDFPRERLTISQVGLKAIVQKAFSKVFPKQILDEPLRIPEDAKLQSLRGREFKPSLVDARDGWLTIAFR